VFIKVMQVFFVMDSTSDLFDLCPLAYYFLSLCLVRRTRSRASPGLGFSLGNGRVKKALSLVMP
jgi:hypothetical protein